MTQGSTQIGTKVTRNDMSTSAVPFVLGPKKPEETRHIRQIRERLQTYLYGECVPDRYRMLSPLDLSGYTNRKEFILANTELLKAGYTVGAIYVADDGTEKVQGIPCGNDLREVRFAHEFLSFIKDNPDKTSDVQDYSEIDWLSLCDMFDRHSEVVADYAKCPSTMDEGELMDVVKTFHDSMITQGGRKMFNTITNVGIFHRTEDMDGEDFNKVNIEEIGC